MQTTLIIVGAYLIIMLGVAWYFSRNQSLDTYFVNGRQTKLWMMTLSNVAVIIGAGATIAIVTEVYRTGISYGLALPASLMFGLLLLGLFAKRIRMMGDKYNAYTVVDFYGSRFDRKNKILTGVMQLFLQCIWMGIQTVALAALIQVILGVNAMLSVIITIGITLIYTTMGGLKLDMISDFVEFWVLLITFTVTAIIGYLKIGSITSFLEALPQSHLDPFAFGGVSWFVGALLLSGFIFIGNSLYWQRIFAAESPQIARRSFFLAIPIVAFLSVLVIFFGLLSASLLPGISADTALFTLLQELLGPVFASFGIAAMLVMLMSSIDSNVVAGSAVLYREFYDKSIHRVSRARFLTAVFGTVGGLIALLIPDIITLSLLVTYLALILVPSALAGLYSKRISANASFSSLLIPAIVLLVAFPFLEKNTFLITTPLSVAILFLYDPLMKNRAMKKPTKQHL